MDTIDLRKLTTDPTVKCCSICGKPESRATKDVRALPHHAAALEKDTLGRTLAEQARVITKYLGLSALDYATGEKFNGQLESIKLKLVSARAEHDAYAPAEKVSDKQAVMRVLLSALGMVGVSITAEQAEALEHSPLSLAQALHSEIESINRVMGGEGLRSK